MSNPNQLPILTEILELQLELLPKLERFESLKREIREFGPGDYPVDDLGTVKVTAPSIAAPKGTEIKVDAAAFNALPTNQQSKLIEDGVLQLVTVFSRAAASSVKVEPIK